MSDNQDLKSKILLMRQKNFNEVVNEANEKNDNEKPEDAKLSQSETNTASEQNKDEPSQSKDEAKQNKFQAEIQYDKNLDINDLKENLNKVSKTNEKAFDLLANKFNESVEVILELTQRVEKLETLSKLQSMQESVKKTEHKSSPKGLKFFLFLLFIAGISYFLYKFKIDISIIKDISKDFLTILGK